MAHPIQAFLKEEKKAASEVRIESSTARQPARAVAFHPVVVVVNYDANHRTTQSKKREREGERQEGKKNYHSNCPNHQETTTFHTLGHLQYVSSLVRHTPTHTVWSLDP